MDEEALNLPPDSWHILSYPRSGNHLVRCILEANARRPTEGCIGVSSDPPIYMRAANLENRMIEIENTRPIGYKAHLLREVLARNRMAEGPRALLFLLRNPVDAIASQLMHSKLEARGVLSLQVRKRKLFLERAVESYLSLILLYRSWDFGPRFLVRFERLVDASSREKEIDRILSAAGVKRRYFADDTDRLFALANDSQVEKIRAHTDRVTKAKALVAQMIEPGEVERLLARKL